MVYTQSSDAFQEARAISTSYTNKESLWWEVKHYWIEHAILAPCFLDEGDQQDYEIRTCEDFLILSGRLEEILSINLCWNQLDYRPKTEGLNYYMTIQL